MVILEQPAQALAADDLAFERTDAGLWLDELVAKPLVFEFDHDGDGVVDGTTATESDGTFLYEPTPLSFGPVTIAARGVEWDEAAGVYQRGPWVSLSFTYEDQPSAAPALVELAVAPPGPLDYQPRAVGLAGRIVNEGNLASQTVEFDYDNDGLFDGTAQTDKYGKFSFTPAGLAYGASEIHVRTRELDDITRQFLYGPWTAFSFDNVEPVNQAAVITTLALANDTGTDGDGTSTDDTLSGQITNDGLLDGVTIQFDLDNDDASDGEATTDEAGLFTFQPADLAAGQHTVRARSLEYSGAGVAIEGAWHSVTFTLVAAADPTLRVDTLGLSHDTGDSDSDGATDNPAIEGTVVGSSVSGVSVQIDTDGDGQTDITTTTDSSGHFSVTPQNLIEGRITAQARVAPPDDGTGDSMTLAGDSSGGSSNNWKSLSFVYSSDPDGATAQLLVTSFHNFDQDWQSAQNTYDGTLATANSTYRGAYAAAVGAYNATLSAAGAARATVVTAATATFNAAKTIAERAYVAAVTADGTTFTTNLANFSGDTSSFTLPDFQWPDAPVDNSLIIPADSSQATPPGTSPNYDYTPYDLSAEPAYQSGQVAKQAEYDRQVLDATTLYKQKEATAKSNYDRDAKLVRDTFRLGSYTVDAAYKAALLAGTPPVDMDAVRAEFNTKSQQVYDKYNLNLRESSDKYGRQIVSTLTSYMYDEAGINVYYGAAMIAAGPHSVDPGEIHDSLLRMANVNIAWTTDLGARTIEYQMQLANYARERVKSDANSLFKRDKALAELRQGVDAKQAELNHWQYERQLNAEQKKTADLANLTFVRDRDLAELARVRDNDIATARQVLTMDLATANIDFQRGMALYAATKIGAWSQFEATTGATYQKEMADHQVQYLDSLRPKFLLHEQARSGATLVEAMALNQAQKNQDERLAAADRDRAVQRSEALLTLQKAANDADWERIGKNAVSWQNQDTARALGESSFAQDLADAQYILSTSNAQAAAAYEVAEKVVDRDFVYSTDQAAKDAALVVQQKVYSDAMADNAHTYALSSIDDQDRRGEWRSLYARKYQQEYNAWEQTDHDKTTDAYSTFDTSLASVERDRSVKIAQALGLYDLDSAAADVAWWQTVAPADYSFAGFNAQYQKTQSDADAVSTQTFQVNTASGYAFIVGAWNFFYNTPWTNYQSTLAQAEKTRAIGQSAIDVAQSQALSQANVDQTLAQEAAYDTYYMDEADAYKARVDSVVVATYNFAVNVGAAQVTDATTTASKTGEHDKAIVARNLVYQNKIATEQEQLQDAVDQAHWGYLTSLADADWLLAKKVIEAPEFTSRVIAAMSAELDEQGLAEVSRANALATARQSWIHDTGVLNVTLVQDKTTADLALAATTKDKTIELAGLRAEAAKTLADTIGEKVRKRTVDLALADAGYNLAFAESAYHPPETLDSPAAIQRKNVALAQAEYELALYTAHATKMAAAYTTELSPLASYQWSVADADLAQATAKRNSQVTLQDVLKAADTQATSRMNAAAYGKALTYSGSAGIDLAYTGRVATADKEESVAYDKALADGIKDQRAAAAVRTESEAIAQLAYQYAMAGHRATLDDDLAAASVAWVASMADAKADLHADPTASGAQAEFDSSQAVADGIRQGTQLTARSQFADRVGTAQITRARDLGEAIVVEATSVATAGVTYNNALIAADQAYGPKITQAETIRQSDSSAADNAFSDESASTQSEATGSQESARAGHQGRLGTADVTRATSVATAEAGYQFDVADAIATVTAGWSGTVETPFGDFKAADAAAFAAWIQSVTPDFIAFRAVSAQADVDHDVRLIAAENQGDGLRGGTQSGFDHDSQAIETARGAAAFARQRTFDESQATRDGVRSDLLVQADGLRGIDYAKAAKQFAIDQATAEKTYQVAVANNFGVVTDAMTKQRTADRANADLGNETRLADADQAWTGRLAEANSTFVNIQSAAVQSLQADLRAIDKSDAIAVAVRQAAMDNALTGIDNVVSAAETVAENLWESGVTIAKSAFWSSEYAGKSSALGGFASALGTPWAMYQASLAGAVSGWWTGVTAAYEGWTADSNAASTTYDTSVADAKVAHTAAVETASVTSVTAGSSAEETLQNSFDASQTAYLLALVGPTETYIKSVALAERNSRVAKATAARNLIVGVVDGQTYDSNANDAALAAAESQRTSAIQSAKNIYATAEAILRGVKFVTDSGSQLTYTVTTGAASLAAAAATGNADKVSAIAQSAAENLWSVTVAAVDAARSSGLGQTLSSAVTAFASGTPWGLFDKGHVSAAATEESADSASQETLDTVTADADKTQADAAAAAAETLGNLVAATKAAWQQAVATAYGTLRTGEATARNGLAAAGQYLPSLPIGPDSARGGDRSVTPASVDDYFASLGSASPSPTAPMSGFDQFDGFITQMFSSTADDWANGATTPRLTTDRLTERMTRGSAPAAGTDLRTPGEKAAAAQADAVASWNTLTSVLSVPTSYVSSVAASVGSAVAQIATNAWNALGNFFTPPKQESVSQVEDVKDVVQYISYGEPDVPAKSEATDKAAQPAPKKAEDPTDPLERLKIVLDHPVPMDYTLSAGRDSVTYQREFDSLDISDRTKVYWVPNHGDIPKIFIGTRTAGTRSSWVEIDSKLGGGHATVASLSLIIGRMNLSLLHTESARLETARLAIQSVVSPFTIVDGSKSVGIFIDGTGNHLGDITNVVRMYNVYQETKFYYGGVGNPIDFTGEAKRKGERYGTGWNVILERAMADLINTWKPGIPIDIFGFSRGGAMAIELAWLLKKDGLLVNGTKYYPDVRVLGLFDPVYSINQPGQDSDLIDKTKITPVSRAGGFVYRTIPDNVRVVIDIASQHEERSFILATIPQRSSPNTRMYLFQVPGAHCDVGGWFGSNPNTQAVAFHMMAMLAKQHNAPIEDRGLDPQLSAYYANILVLSAKGGPDTVIRVAFERAIRSIRWQLWSKEEFYRQITNSFPQHRDEGVRGPWYWEKYIAFWQPYQHEWNMPALVDYAGVLGHGGGFAAGVFGPVAGLGGGAYGMTMYPNQRLAARIERQLGRQGFGYVSDYMMLPDLDYRQFIRRDVWRGLDGMPVGILQLEFGREWFIRLDHFRLNPYGYGGFGGMSGYDEYDYSKGR